MKAQAGEVVKTASQSAAAPAAAPPKPGRQPSSRKLKKGRTKSDLQDSDSDYSDSEEDEEQFRSEYNRESVMTDDLHIIGETPSQEKHGEFLSLVMENVHLKSEVDTLKEKLHIANKEIMTQRLKKAKDETKEKPGPKMRFVTPIGVRSIASSFWKNIVGVETKEGEHKVSHELETARDDIVLNLSIRSCDINAVEEEATKSKSLFSFFGSKKKKQHYWVELRTNNGYAVFQKLHSGHIECDFGKNVLAARSHAFAAAQVPTSTQVEVMDQDTTFAGQKTLGDILDFVLSLPARYQNISGTSRHFAQECMRWYTRYGGSVVGNAGSVSAPPGTAAKLLLGDEAGARFSSDMRSNELPVSETTPPGY